MKIVKCSYNGTPKQQLIMMYRDGNIDESDLILNLLKYISDEDAYNIIRSCVASKEEK